MNFYLNGKPSVLISIFVLVNSNKVDMWFFKIKLAIFFSIIISMSVNAQQKRFIYLQSDNNAPFFVKMEGKHLSSSEYGYMIIPQLKDSIYSLIIGTTINNLITQDVSISTMNTNAGFLIQSNDAKSITLVNLSTLQPFKPVTKQVSSTLIKNKDEFARILAEVVGDPSIAQIEIETGIPEVKKDELSKTLENVRAEPIINDSIKTNATENNKPHAINNIQQSDTIKTTAADKYIGKISRLSYDSMPNGLKMKYVDVAVVDTIEIFIPVNKVVVKNNIENESTTSYNEQVHVVNSNTDTRFLDMKLQNPNATTDSASQKNDFVIFEKKSENQQPSANSDLSEKAINNNTNCKNIATQKGFLKLRSQMASAKNEPEMTKTAINTFASTCFNTEQIKNLGALYLLEEERYKFYVAAYSYVTDLNNFISLQDQLTESYYKERFKAMISK